MNILAFVDLHGSRRAFEHLAKRAEESDLLLCAGDISLWERGLEKIFSFFENLNKPLLIIPGNHENAESMLAAAGKFKFIAFLHKASYEFHDMVFFGYGGGGFASQDKNLESISKKFISTIKPGQKKITFSHAPPYGTALDFLQGVGHRGCISTRKLIEDVNPLVHICGHLHENWGKQDKIGNTVIINPGPQGIILKV
ncbi:metallophosphoesterase family protein [archaeon]|nr:metallophosphoesterase family protein [archaeon]